MTENHKLPHKIICPRAALQDGGTGVRFHIRLNRPEAVAQRVSCVAIAFGGTVYAYQNACPHRGTELDWQPGEVFDETGLYLICATHGASFEADTGLCVGGPCKGDRLTSIPVLVEHDQVVLCESNIVIAENDQNADDVL